MARPVTGLALGSGAARGWSHIGVIHALESAGIKIDVVTGTSAGAVVAAFLAAGAVSRLEELTDNHKSIMNFLSLLELSYDGPGLVSGKKWVEYIREYLPARRFEDLKIPLGIVAADLYSMQEMHISEGALLPAIRASVSVPGFLVPEAQGDMQLVDGGILNPVPVNLARKLGATFVIAVDLNAHVEKRMSKTTAQVMDRSIEIMMNRIRQVNYELYPADITIEPLLQDFSFTDYHRVTEATRAGYDAAHKKVEEIKQALQKPLSIDISMISLVSRIKRAVSSTSFSRAE
jgi:NTE family protein